MATDNEYTIPAPSVNIGTTGTIGDLNITDQLPVGDNGLSAYPSDTKTWDQNTVAPTKTHTVFTRDIITTELPGADSVGENQDSNEWTAAHSDIDYTYQSNGKGI